MRTWIVKHDEDGRLFTRRGRSAKRVLKNLGDPGGIKYSVVGVLNPKTLEGLRVKK